MRMGIDVPRYYADHMMGGPFDDWLREVGLIDKHCTKIEVLDEAGCRLLVTRMIAKDTKIELGEKPIDVKGLELITEWTVRTPFPPWALAPLDA